MRDLDIDILIGNEFISLMEKNVPIKFSRYQYFIKTIIQKIESKISSEEELDSGTFLNTKNSVAILVSKEKIDEDQVMDFVRRMNRSKCQRGLIFTQESIQSTNLYKFANDYSVKIMDKEDTYNLVYNLENKD